MIGTSERWCSKPFFFCFWEGMHHAAWPFLLVFRISRTTDPVLSPKICGKLAYPNESFAWQGNRPHQAKREAQTRPRCSQPYLTIQQCYTWYETVFFFGHGTSRTRKVRLNGHRTEPVNPTRCLVKRFAFL